MADLIKVTLPAFAAPQMRGGVSWLGRLHWNNGIMGSGIIEFALRVSSCALRLELSFFSTRNPKLTTYGVFSIIPQFHCSIPKVNSEASKKYLTFNWL
jgi:hypothetical protein